MPTQSASPAIPALPGEILIPQTFTRHRRQLRALLIEQQCWFCATDLVRLIGQPHLDERATRTLDADQLIDAVVLNTHGQPETTRLISESGVYAALIHYYPPGEPLHPPLDHRRRGADAARSRTTRRAPPEAREPPGAVVAALAWRYLDALPTDIASNPNNRRWWMKRASSNLRRPAHVGWTTRSLSTVAHGTKCGPVSHATKRWMKKASSPLPAQTIDRTGDCHGGTATDARLSRAIAASRCIDGRTLMDNHCMTS